VPCEGVELGKRVRIKQLLQPLTCGQLAALMLVGDARLTATKK